MAACSGLTAVAFRCSAQRTGFAQKLTNEGWLLASSP